MDTFITIVMLIVLLLVLIGFHEAGHFAVAKMCRVYCAEFSLGFGPKLFSIKRKNWETAFTVRALPLGGYVSMYSEEGQLDEDEVVSIPKERSLEGQAWPKRLAIILAGVIMNFLLTLVFCYAYALCYPQHSVTLGNYWTYVNVENELVQVAPVGILHLEENVEVPQFSESDNEYPFYKGIVLSNPSRPDEAQLGGYLIDSDVLITTAETSFKAVAIFNPTTVTSDSDFVDSLTFYPQISLEEARNRSNQYTTYEGWPNLLEASEETLNYLGVDGYPDLSQEAYHFDGGESVEFSLSTISRVELEEEGYFDISSRQDFDYVLRAAPSQSGDIKLESGNLRLLSREYWLDAADRFAYGSQLWCNLWVSMGGGLYALFTGNFGSLSGPVGIGVALGTMASMGGWAYSFFYLGALVSLNLAIINLFPIPGLDGWAALTTIYETITHKKIKERTKNIVSYIGLGLILLLAVVILIMDIVRLF